MSEPKLEISIKTGEAGRTRKLPLNRRTVSVGTQLSNDIVLNGNNITDQHCLFEIQDHPNSIIFRERGGQIVGMHGAPVPDGEVLKFGTQVWIGETIFSIERLDTPEPLPFAPEEEESESEETADDLEAGEEDFVEESAPPQSAPQPEDGGQDEKSNTSFSAIDPEHDEPFVSLAPPEKTLEDTKPEPVVKKLSNRLPLVFFGIVIVSLVMGVGGFFYISSLTTTTPVKTVVEIDPETWTTNTIVPDYSGDFNSMEMSSVMLENSIRTILLENEFEISEVNLTKVPYYIEGYTQRHASVMNARQRIDELIDESVIFRLYADQTIEPSVDAVLSTINGNVSIESLSYGKLNLEGEVSEEGTVDNLTSMLMQDIPYLREVNTQGIMVINDDQDMDNRPFLEKIVGVWLGQPPHLKMVGGRRHMVGDVLEDGRIIADITQKGIVLRNQDQVEIIPIDRLQ